MWYSDAQGLEMIDRTINKRPYWPKFEFKIAEPESFNYVPMNEAAYIKDGSKQYTFITDRSRGCACQADGAFEMMLQRRTLADDGRGVAEPLNETITLRTKNVVSLSSVQEASVLQRLCGIALNNEPTLIFANVDSSVQEWIKGKRLSFSGLKTPLPLNIDVMNLKTMPDGRVLLRMHHLFSSDENSAMSKPVQVNLANLFADFSVTKVEEVSLTANQLKSSVKRIQWNTAQNASPKYQFVPLSGNVMTIRPMEIRTFLITIKK